MQSTKCFNLRDAICVWLFSQIGSNSNPTRIYVGRMGYCELRATKDTSNLINRSFNFADGYTLSKADMLEMVIQDFKTIYNVEMGWVGEEKFDYPVWHWNDLVKSLPDDIQHEYACMFERAWDWMNVVLASKFDLNTNEGADKAAEYYNKYFVDHICPILFQLRKLFGIIITDYSRIVKEVDSFDVQEPTEDQLKFLESVRIKWIVEATRCINNEVIRRIAKENGVSQVEIDFKIL